MALESEEAMFKIMRVSKEGKKQWYNAYSGNWCQEFWFGTTYQDFQECLDVLKELRHDLNESLYISVLQD